MKIALIGATGYTGAEILKEALDRGHDVTAIVRDAGKVPKHPKVVATAADATDEALLAKILAGHDVVISAFNPGKDPTDNGTKAILAAVKNADVERLLVVGGAGSLEVAPGKKLIDQPDFPAEWKDGALKTSAFLETLRAETSLDWCFVSPAAVLAPGSRTGIYRIGGDQLLTDEKGQCHISTSDLAVAMIDEAEQPKHHQKRISVAY